jgi:hypothetical protein
MKDSYIIAVSVIIIALTVYYRLVDGAAPAILVFGAIGSVIALAMTLNKNPKRGGNWYE